MRKLLYLCVLCICCLCAGVHAEEWKKNQSASGDGIDLYTQDVPGKSFKNFKGEATFNAPMKEVLALVMVRETYPRWWYNMREVTTLTKDNADQSLAYYWIKGVWPAEDRDAVVHNEVTQNRQTLEVTFHSVSADPTLVEPRQDRVRLRNIDTTIRIIPLSPTQTRVVIEGAGDAGGSVPAWLANNFVLDTPKHSLLNLRKLLEDKSNPVDLTMLETNPFAKIHMPEIKFPQ